MKNIVIIGASGTLATYVIDELKKISDVKLTLFVRKRNKLALQTMEGCEIVQGDVLNYESVQKAVLGQDIVYINLAGDLEPMARNIVRAMQQTRVKRVIAISSIGIYKYPLKSVLIPYRKLADIIEESGLEYTILRPDWFTYADEVDYILTHKGKPETGTAIARKSIAAFVSKIVQDTQLHKNENLGISKP